MHFYRDKLGRFVSEVNIDIKLELKTLMLD
jgi:hypothetical protein